MMSVELPEAKILAEQMNVELRGKRIKSYHLQDHERLQRIGMLNKDTNSFDQLVTGKVEAVTSRGNVIRVKLSNGMNLILGPEYGGQIFYHTSGQPPAPKFHLRVDFDDGTVLTVRLTSMGLINAVKDTELDRSYVFRRDFNTEVLSPTDEEFTADRFGTLLADNNRMLKSVLVGKDAVLVGLSNSAFQDIIYRAKLHPKRKASELSKDERRALYDAIESVLRERLRLGGKDEFLDLYGNQGSYTPAMGPSMKQQSCPVCGTSIEKLSVGGGHVYFCPTCQV
jgi:formamidopyrimidine-DNA glycosylase